MAYKYVFNPEKYLELLEKEKKYAGTDQKLTRFELLERVSYSTQFADYLTSKNKDEIIIWIKKFINYKIDAEEFSEQFFKLCQPNPKLFYRASLESLQDVKIDPDFFSFSLMKSTIILGIDLYELDDEEFTEDKFRNLVDREYKRLLDFESVIDAESHIDLAQLIQRSYITLLVVGGILLLNFLNSVLG